MNKIQQDVPFVENDLSFVLQYSTTHHPAPDHYTLSIPDLLPYQYPKIDHPVRSGQEEQQQQLDNNDIHSEPHTPPLPPPKRIAARFPILTNPNTLNHTHTHTHTHHTASNNLNI